MKLPKNIMSTLTPSPVQSRTSMSFKTPGRDLEDRWILMKLSVMLPRDIMSTLTPSPAPSGTSMSSKTPGRDLEDRWSLDEVPDVGS